MFFAFAGVVYACQVGLKTQFGAGMCKNNVLMLASSYAIAQTQYFTVSRQQLTVFKSHFQTNSIALSFQTN
jgi:hypothetical protein